MKSASTTPPRLSNKLTAFASLFVAALLSGCATPCCAPPPPAPLVATPTKISATGYGTPGSYGQYTPAQQRLMAIRAAQIDAYRNLAERVYGFRVTGATTVSAFMTQSDKVRAHVDAFIRGAHVVNTAVIADGNVEVTVELDLTPRFFQCMTNWNGCNAATAPALYATYPGCVAYGCVSPSSNYYSY